MGFNSGFKGLIFPPMPGSSKWSLSLSSPPKTTLLPYTCYMSHPFHSSRLYHPNNIGWAVQIIKLLIIYFSPLPCSLVPLRPKYSPQHPILKHLRSTFLPQCERPSFPPVQNKRQSHRYEPHNDVSVNDGPHIRRWSYNIIILTIVLQLPTVFSTVICCTGL